MKINVHAGHNPDGKVACGAVGLIHESTEARNVVSKLVVLLQKAGHTVYNCTVNDGTSQSDVLNKIVRKCNANNVDLDISIHFNAGAKDISGNGATTGTEVLVYNKATKAYTYAEKVCTEISKLGYKNRGVKVNQGLYFLNNTKSPAMLIECCFVDDADDVKLYSADKMAVAIAKAVVGDIKEDEEMEKVYNTMAELPQWAQATIQKLIDKKYLSGDNGKLGLTETAVRVFVVNDRAGLY